MKQKIPVDFRPARAAAVVLLVLAGAFQAAVRWPGRWRPPLVATARQLTQPAAATRSVTPADVAAAPASASLPKPCPPHPLVFSLGGGRRALLVRRYVGLVGGQAATAVLQGQHPDSLTGSFYLHQGGPAYALTSAGPPAGRAVVLAVALDGIDVAPSGWWQLLGRPGAVLAGTWRPANGRPQRLLLHESYAGALRYTFHKAVLAGDYRVPGACNYVPQVEHWLLTLPRPLSAPPVLRPRLATSPAALRRRLRADHDANDEDATAAYQDEVRLNGFQLFSYQTSSHTRSYGGTPTEGLASWLFDLRTGQELPISSQLNPDYERPLRRLLTQHLLHDSAFAEVNTSDANRRAHTWDWRDDRGRPSPLVKLPADHEALTLTGPGLEATYSYNTLYNTGPDRQTSVLVPYRELRPLVRPGTPLARMLRARGLW